MLASQATTWLTAGALLLLIAYHEYIWFAAFQQPRIFRHRFAGSQKDPECTHTSCYRYYNSKSAPFLIESWPDVGWNTGEFYSGSIRIDESDPSRTLFFIFKPTANRLINGEIVVWLNGGPGCSSLYGFASENGPIAFQTDGSPDANHGKNPFAWSDMTNMLWVEYPAGTGFSQQEPDRFNQLDIARDFAKFFQKWQQMFRVRNYKIYLTGESFAGRYIPYIANEMLDRNDKVHFDLRGVIMYSPAMSDRKLEGLIPRYPFTLANNDILRFNQTNLDAIRDVHVKCGFDKYINEYLVYPPSGIQSPEKIGRGSECDTVVPFYSAVHEGKPCYVPLSCDPYHAPKPRSIADESCHHQNVYHITDECPSASKQTDAWLEIYFNRRDVKEALHAPFEKEWSVCTNEVGSDPHKISPPPIQGVLPRLIESTSRVLIASGGLDGIILTNGTLLAIQNMTFNGKLGFQERPTQDFVLPADARGPQEVVGKQHYERGLQWVETYESGHEQPMYAPRAALRQLQWLRGDIEAL